MNGEIFDRVRNWEQSSSMLLPLLIAAAVQAAPPPETIVVTGVPLSTLKAQAEDCEKADCPIRDDIVATVRYAEGLFRIGRYLNARESLHKAISRNRGRATGDPAAMSALYEATATVARHDGEQKVVLDSAFARVRLLRATEAADPKPLLFASLDAADAVAEYQSAFEANKKYASVVSKAKAANEPIVAAQAMLHQASLAHAQRKDREANELLEGVSAMADGLPSGYRLAGRAMAARFARDRGDKKAVDSLVNGLVAEQGGSPILIWSPKTPEVADEVSRDPTTVPVVSSANLSADYFMLGWADIGFMIKPDGTVDTPDVLRSNRKEGWAVPIMKMIAGRRYVPLGNSNAQYRVERWTLTADYATPMDSNIRRRSLNPHYEQLDMTDGRAPPVHAAP